MFEVAADIYNLETRKRRINGRFLDGSPRQSTALSRPVVIGSLHEKLHRHIAGRQANDKVNDKVGG